MCWNTPDGENCDACQAIFDACEHDTTFKNKDSIKECVFCGKKVI